MNYNWAMIHYNLFGLRATALLGLAVAMVLPFSARAQDPIAGPTYTLAPLAVDAGKAFDLSLTSTQFTCGTTFDSLSYSVYEFSLTLNFRPHEHKGVACPVLINQAYGPTFKIEALKAGNYRVRGWDLRHCAPPPLSVDCRVMSAPDFDGTLAVGPAAERKTWFLAQKEEMPEKTFTMQLLSSLYGNCQTEFSHQSFTVEKDRISTTFTIDSYPDRVCIRNVSPWGPSFEMPAMQSGSYPVWVSTPPGCVYAKPACMINIPISSSPEDTLLVTRTSSMLISQLRAEGLGAELQGDQVRFDLPKGAAGAWRIELVTLSGARLAAGTVEAGSGLRSHLRLDVSPEAGIYLLHAQGPDGSTHSIPVIGRP